MTEPFFIGCQLSKQCIVFGYYSGTEDWKKCRPRMQYGPAATPTNPDFINRVPPECTKDKDPTLIADKRPTSRRFDFGFSVLASQNAIVATMVSWFKQYKAETAVFCSTTEKSFVTNFLPPAYAAFTANKIRLLGETTYLPLNGVAWTDDEALAFALHVRDLNPDVLVMLVASTYPGDIQSGAKLITKFREIDYLPKAILMPGGGNQYVATLLNWLRPNLETSDAAFIYGSASNSFAMRGANYDAQTGTGADAVWEPYPSDGQTLSNQALLREYLKVSSRNKRLHVDGSFFSLIPCFHFAGLERHHPALALRRRLRSHDRPGSSHLRVQAGLPRRVG
jgi:hypothetical protein